MVGTLRRRKTDAYPGKKHLIPVKIRRTDWAVFYVLWFIWVLALPVMYMMAGFRNRRQ